MKKIVSILLTVILLSCCITTAFAASENKDQSIKEKLIQTYLCGDDSIDKYEELYFHKNLKNEFDWALIYATTYSATDEMIYRKLGDIVIEQDHGDIPFEVGYAIYDYEDDKFYDIIDVWNSDKHKDLHDVFSNIYLKKNQSIKEKLIQTYLCGDDSIDKYEELYFHKNLKNEFDWALIYATTYSATDEMIYRRLGDIVIEQDHGDIPFEVGYAIYDYENDKFYDIIEAWDSDKYEDLHEAFTNVYLKKEPNHYRYFDKLYDQYEYLVPPEEIEKYDELYYHTNSKGEIDWALVYIYYDCILDTAIVRGVLGGKTIYLPGPEYPFATGYGLYDVAKGQFYDLWNNTLFDQYDDLFEVWQSIDTSEIEPEKYLGDANGDNIVDIIDATYIQRYLISRVSKYEIAETAADVDNDGDVTILDTTRIQRALVGVCSLD